MIKSKLIIYYFKEMDLEYLHGVQEIIIKVIIFKISNTVTGRYIGQMGVIIKVNGKSIYLNIIFKLISGV